MTAEDLAADTARAWAAHQRQGTAATLRRWMEARAREAWMRSQP